MAKEIERKFLVANDAWKKDAAAGATYRQGYIATNGDATVRVRVAAGQGYLTLKGKPLGITRSEFEYKIPRDDAEAMLDELCGKGQIEKTRYRVTAGELVWEIDVFDGANAGLVVAEIELPTEDTPFDRPAWLDGEVSHDRRYTNASLALFPYTKWDSSGEK